VLRPYNRTAGIGELAGAEVGDVDVYAEADVIGQVPTVVVRIFVDHHLVGIPEPIVAEGDVVLGDTEVKAAKPEARRSAAGDAKDMAAAEAAGEVAVFPRMIHVVVGIVAAGIVTNSLVVGVDVRRVRVPGLSANVGCSGAGCGWPRNGAGP
jgi:hypothetical protein